MDTSVPADPAAPKPGSLISLMKEAGRKFSWAFAALFGICALNALGTLKEERFELCFGALTGAVMAANYGEHREKQRAAAKEAANVPAA